MRTRHRVESAKGKARQGRRVSLCGAGLRGNPGLTGYERAEASLGLCRPHPPFSPPPASSSPSSFLVFLLLLLFPLRHSSYHQEKGAGQKAARRRAPTASKISLIGQPRRLLVFNALPYIFVGARNLRSQDSLFSQPPFAPLTSFPSGPRLPRPKPSLPL